MVEFSEIRFEIVLIFVGKAFREWSGAGVGVGMLSGSGDSLTCKDENYQIPISYFLIDMKFLSKILKKCLRGSSSFFCLRLRELKFSKLKISQLQAFTAFKTSKFQSCKKS